MGWWYDYRKRHPHAVRNVMAVATVAGLLGGFRQLRTSIDNYDESTRKEPILALIRHGDAERIVTFANDALASDDKGKRQQAADSVDDMAKNLAKYLNQKNKIDSLIAEGKMEMMDYNRLKMQYPNLVNLHEMLQTKISRNP
jgi:hypothetical protein